MKAGCVLIRREWTENNFAGGKTKGFKTKPSAGLNDQVAVISLCGDKICGDNQNTGREKHILLRKPRNIISLKKVELRLRNNVSSYKEL